MSATSRIFKPISFLLIAGFMLGSCSNSNDNHKNVNIRFQSFPFYKDYIAIDTNHISESLEQLKKKYPNFLNIYLDKVMDLGGENQVLDTAKALSDFLTYKDYRNLFDTVVAVFPNTAQQDKAIKTAFKNLKYNDSAFIIPSRVYYYISYLSLAAFTESDTVLGIGLDMFLGQDFQPYSAVNIPKYATLQFTKENIPVWACRVVYQNRFPFNPENKNLLDLMIEKGKEIYFLKKCLPNIPERLFLGFTDKQMEWCKNNEVYIYNFFVQHQLLYETNLQDIMKYVQNGPNTSGFPPDAPGNLGTYIGWKIMTAYAGKEEGTLESLLQNKDAAQILHKAKYKP